MIMRSKWMMALVLVCLTVLLGWIVWPSRADNVIAVTVPSAHPPEPQSDPADPQIQALTAELAHLRAQVGTLAQQAQKSSPSVVEQESADDARREPPKEVHPPSREEQVAQQQEVQAQARQQRDATVTQIEGRLVTEEPDTTWSNQSMASLQANLQAPTLSGSHFSDMSCGSSLCRVAFVHDNEEAEDTFMEEMVAFETFANTETFYTRTQQADGSVAVTMYVARQGQKLPLPGRREGSPSR